MIGRRDVQTPFSFFRFYLRVAANGKARIDKQKATVHRFGNAKWGLWMSRMSGPDGMLGAKQKNESSYGDGEHEMYLVFFCNGQLTFQIL